MLEEKATSNNTQNNQPFEENITSSHGETHRESKEKPLFDKIEEAVGLNPSDANLLSPK